MSGSAGDAAGREREEPGRERGATADLAIGDADLARWVADARAAESARSRQRQRWLRHQAEEEATFAGVLLDMAEQATPVVARTAAGRTHVGVIAAVGADFVALVASTEPEPAGALRAHSVVLLATARLASVRPAPAPMPSRSGRREAASGGRETPLDATLAATLAAAAADRPRVVIGLDRDSELVSGELVGVGADVLSVIVPGTSGVEGSGAPASRSGQGPVAYLSLPLVSEISLRGSG